MAYDSNTRLLLRYRVELEVHDDPADTQFVFHAPDGPVRLRADEAVEPLSNGIRALNADHSARAWATPAIIAKRLMDSGRVSHPTGGEQQQLHAASTGVDPDPQRAHYLVRSFVSALAHTAPGEAQRRQPYRAPSATARTPRRDTTFSHILAVEADEEPDDDCIATVRLHIRNDDKGWAPVPVRDLWHQRDHFLGDHGRDAVIAMSRRLSELWTPAARLVEHAGPDHDGTDRDATGFSGELRVGPRELAELAHGRLVSHFLAHRIEVQWPDTLRHYASVHSVARIDDQPGSTHSSLFDRVVRFDWRVAVGDHTLTAAEMDSLATSHHNLIKLGGQWRFVDREHVNRLAAEHTGELPGPDALRAALTGRAHIHGHDVAVEVSGRLDEIRRRLTTDPAELDVLPQPHALAGTLRDYQQTGLRWLQQLTELGLGGCLADDMGLGKTIMMIALHLHCADTLEAPTLVVCPASVIRNWEREIARFAPTVPIRRHHGSERGLEDVKEGFVLTTYATMRRDAARLRDHEPGWGMVIADEAQQIKNSRSSTAHALRSLGGTHRFALTGTPVENALSELWAILDWTTPGLLGTHGDFRRDFIRPIESDHDDQRAGDLARLIRPFVLRRRKSDPTIAPELPAKTVTDHWFSLTREQAGLYRSTVNETLRQIESSDGVQRRGLIIKLLTHLKQICNHPAHFLHQYDDRLPQRSGKLDFFDGLIDQILAEDTAVLVFTQYAQMGTLLQRHLHERSIPSLFLHGQTSVQQRETMISRFQNGEIPVFVMSLRAAGIGLNLTAADHVIHFDRWWNPAVEDQATDRAHRIGQHRPVQVHRLNTHGTLEESIAELISSKRALADSIINSTESALTELSDAALSRLVTLRDADSSSHGS